MNDAIAARRYAERRYLIKINLPYVPVNGGPCEMGPEEKRMSDAVKGKGCAINRFVKLLFTSACIVRIYKVYMRIVVK
jgi:hypothetical protein